MKSKINLILPDGTIRKMPVEISKNKDGFRMKFNTTFQYPVYYPRNYRLSDVYKDFRYMWD
jgi:hypothetical protein